MVLKLSEERLILFKDTFNTYMLSKKYSDRTREEYFYYLDKLKPFSEISQGTINLFLLDSSTNNNICRSFLRAFIKCLIRTSDTLQLTHEEIETLTKLDIESLKNIPKKPEVQPLSEEQIQTLIDSYPKVGGKLMIELVYKTGLRAKEILDLKVSDFEWKSWLMNPAQQLKLNVRGKGDRVGILWVNGEFAKRLYDRTLNLYGSFENLPPEKLMFEISYNAFWKKLRRVSQKCLGINVHPHQLRHTFGTRMMYKSGGNIKQVQKAMRHSSITTTQRYLHVSQEEMRALFEKI